MYRKNLWKMTLKPTTKGKKGKIAMICTHIYDLQIVSKVIILLCNKSFEFFLTVLKKRVVSVPLATK